MSGSNAIEHSDQSSKVNHGDNPRTAVRWTLRTLIQQLQFAQEHLSNAYVRAMMNENLHGTEEGQLPDAEIAGLAAEAINLLDDLQQRLKPSHLVLADHFFGYMDTKCLVSVVQLGIPDALAKHPLKLSDLATFVNARPDRLRQVLTTLRNNGIFAYDADTDTYSNNHRSELLTNAHWTQWRNWVDLYGNEFYDIARGIPASLAADTTRSAAQHSFDTVENMFTYFEKQGWLPRLHRTLGGGAIAQAAGIAEDYPWEEVEDKTVLDIGGGSGALAASLLRRYRGMKGGVFDLGEVIEHIRPFFQPGGKFDDVGNRVSAHDLVEGNFFAEVPSYEVYTMKWCLHDWNDGDATKILQNIRRAIIPGEKSRVVVLESVMTEGEMGRLSRYGDINMMMTAKGQERSEGDWRRLAESSGWNVVQIYPLRNAWVCAIDMRPV